MSSMLLNFSGPDLVVPGQAPADLAVAANFERFDGLDLPNTNPADKDPSAGGVGTGYDYGFDIPGHYPRPGQVGTPVVDQTYTPGPIKGTVGVIGGQPLPVGGRLQGAKPMGSPTLVREYNTQQRKGVGQNYQGVAQTVQLSAITNNPPEPAGMEAILGGWG